MIGNKPVCFDKTKRYPIIYLNGGKIRVHRFVMDNHLRKTRGYGLQPGETVHHKNGDKMDWRLENLELWAANHPTGHRIDDVRDDLRYWRKRVKELEEENKRLRLAKTNRPGIMWGIGTGFLLRAAIHRGNNGETNA